MSYSYRTSVFQIPAFGQGDIESASENKGAADIIDRHLDIALRSVNGATNTPDANGILTEGTYTGNFVSGASTVTLSSLDALINSVYIKNSTNVSWTGLLNNTTYYLFATLVEAALESSRRTGIWTPTIDTTITPPANSILLAKAVTTGSAITVTSNATALPTKDYSKWIGYHRTATTLDHPANSVTQDKLAASGVGANNLGYYSVNARHLDVTSIAVSGTITVAASGTGVLEIGHEPTLLFAPLRAEVGVSSGCQFVVDNSSSRKLRVMVYNPNATTQSFTIAGTRYGLLSGVYV